MWVVVLHSEHIFTIFLTYKLMVVAHHTQHIKITTMEYYAHEGQSLVEHLRAVALDPTHVGV